MAYSPASNATSTATLRQQATVWYNRRALSQTKRKFRMLGATEPDVLPLRSGKTVQWYRYQLLPANSTPGTEGDVGAGISLTTNTVSATVSEYKDFATLSTLLTETAIDPIIQNFAENLGYRAGLSVDTVTRNEFDANVASVGLGSLGSYFTVQDLRRANALLTGADVSPREGDQNLAIMHPYIVFDLESDNTAGGFVDLMRWATPELLKDYQERLGEGIVGKAAGCLIKTSTNVTSTGTAPTALYYTYVAGLGGVGSVDLAGRGPTRVEYPDKENFKVNVIYGGPQIADPEGTIGAAVSYRFVYVAKTLDTSPFRYRIITSDASLV